MFNKIPFSTIVVFFCLFFLFTCGIIAQLSSAGGTIKPFALHQLIVFGISFPVLLLIWYTKPQTYIKHAYIFYFICIVLLIIVNTIGKTAMGATRWIKFQNITFQPSEFSKISIILILAKYFDSQNTHQIKSVKSFILTLIIVAIPSILILKQPHLGNTIVFCLIAFGIISLTPTKLTHIFFTISATIMSIPLVWSFLHTYQKKRIIAFINPERDPLGIGYNTVQSKIAIGSGSLFGKGFLHGTQTQLSFLPEKQTDFAFTVISEELGMIGSMSIILVYSLLIHVSARTARKAHFYTDKLIAIGITFFFLSHFFINIGMVSGLLPIVGVPLPIVAYGGSITFTSMICIGMLLSIIKNNSHYNRR